MPSKGGGQPPSLGPRATPDLAHRSGLDTSLRLCLLEETTAPAAARPQPRVARYPQPLDRHRSPLPSAASCSPGTAREKLGKREVCAGGGHDRVGARAEATALGGQRGYP
jgi:hypothetical protein